MQYTVSDITWLSESDCSSAVAEKLALVHCGCAEMVVVLAVVVVLAILQVIGVDKIR